MPRFISARVGGVNSSRRRIIDSTVWTLGERALQLVLTWGVSIIVANYLGVAAFGELLYSIALVALFATVVTAGLSGIVVRDLVRDPDRRYEILGTVFVIRLVAGLVSFVVLVAGTYLLGPGASTVAITAIVGIGLFFRVADIAEFWFQSETKLRYVAMASIAATAIGAVMKIVMVILGASLVQFAWQIAIEQALGGIFLLGIYRVTVGPLKLWTFRRAQAGTYLKQSWPLILSGAAGQVNRRIDLVLLGAMIGSTAVGTYAVAARLSEVWYFVPTAIAGAVFPSIVRAKERGQHVYRRRMRQLYGLFAWGAIGIAVLVSFAAHPLIDTLYDQGFSGASDVLVIHVWTAPFLFMGVLFSKWLIVENLLMSSLIRHSFGAVINVGLNLILIPAHGPSGAAIATLVSYAASMYFACFLTRRTWEAGVDMTLGMLLPFTMLYEWVFRSRTGALEAGRP